MRWLPMVCAVVGLACQETPATQVLVRFFAEPGLQREATAIRVTVLDYEGNDIVRTHELEPGDARIATVPVTPHGDDPSRTFRVSAELMGSTGVLAQKLVIGRYTVDELREVNVWFEEACRDVLDCADGRTCDLGVCSGACYAPSPVGEVERHHPTCSTCQDCRAASCLALPDGETPEARSCGCASDRCTSGTCLGARATALAVSGGDTGGKYGHACAIVDDEVYCWGTNRTSQAGGDTGFTTPTLLMGGIAAQNIAAARDHTCATGLVDGVRSCWGYNGHLNLSADMSIERSATPIEGLPGEPQFTGIAAGWFTTFAVTDSGRVYSWGSNGNSELGRTDVPMGEIAAMPGPVDGEGWERITAGGLHACGLRNDGELWCWGWNDDGEVGVGNQDIQPLPVRTGCVDGTCFDDFKAVGAGEWHSCAIRENGEMYCVGQNENGALGIGPDNRGPDFSTWQRVEGAWRSVDGGETHTCAVDANGALFCWGGNAEGQLGLGDFMPRDLPERVALPGGGTIDTVEAGFENTCVIRSEDGAVFCWGANYSGQVGNGGGTMTGVALPSRACF
jgi:alpha-tubulin suppressor-like RCC1 family protein